MNGHRPMAPVAGDIGNRTRLMACSNNSTRLPQDAALSPLAKEAIASVKNGKTRIVPVQWENVFHEWMNNIKDWCISRQIWWGHRIPAWYCNECGEIIVAREPPEACTACNSGNLEQETDVLDTWSSSALWPFSTQGCPDTTDELNTFYPTSVLETALWPRYLHS